VYISNVLAISKVCCKCFIWKLHMLQWLYMYIASMFQMFHLFQTYGANVSSEYCIYFRHMLQASIQNVLSASDVCCKCVYLDVVIATHICCKRIFINVSPVSDVCCCNISRHRKRAHADAVPAGVAVNTCMRVNMHETSVQAHQLHAGRVGVELHVGQVAGFFFEKGGAGLAACVVGGTGAVGGAGADVWTEADVWMFERQPRRSARCCISLGKTGRTKTILLYI
jgi:hypothetical protein